MNVLLRITIIFFCFNIFHTLNGQTQNDNVQDTIIDREEDYQNWNEFSFKERLIVGGNILPAYANGLYLDVSPIIGYRLNNSTIAGVGLTYFYRGIREQYSYISKRVINTYGGRAFVMQYFLPNIFGQVELDYSFLRYHERDPFNNVSYQEFAKSPGFLIGAGYSEGDDYFSYNFTVVYDLLFSSNSTRNSPWVFRGGVLISLY